MRAISPLWTVTAFTTVVVSVSLAPGEADGDGEEEGEGAAVPSVAPPPSATVATAASHARPRTAHRAVTRTARAGNETSWSSRFMPVSYDAPLSATCASRGADQASAEAPPVRIVEGAAAHECGHPFAGDLDLHVAAGEDGADHLGLADERRESDGGAERVAEGAGGDTADHSSVPQYGFAVVQQRLGVAQQEVDEPAARRSCGEQRLAPDDPWFMERLSGRQRSASSC